MACCLRAGDQVAAEAGQPLSAGPYCTLHPPPPRGAIWGEQSSSVLLGAASGLEGRVEEVDEIAGSRLSCSAPGRAPSWRVEGPRFLECPCGQVGL